MDVSIAVSLIRGQMGAVVERAVNGAVETVLAEMLTIVGVKFEELKTTVALMKRDMAALQREKALKEKESDNIRAKLRYTELKLKYYRQGVEEELQQRTSASALVGLHTSPFIQKGNSQKECTSPHSTSRRLIGVAGSHPSDLLLPVSLSINTPTESADSSTVFFCPTERDTALSKVEDPENDCEWTITLQPHTEEGLDPSVAPLHAQEMSLNLGQQTTGSGSPHGSTQADSSTLLSPPPQVKQEEEVICIKEEPEDEQEVMSSLLLECQAQNSLIPPSQAQRSDWSGIQTSKINPTTDHNSAGPSTYVLPQPGSFQRSVASLAPVLPPRQTPVLPPRQTLVLPPRQTVPPWTKELSLYEEYKLRRNDLRKRNLNRRRELEKTLPQPLLADMVRDRREKTRLRVARWRAKRKLQARLNQGQAQDSTAAPSQTGLSVNSLQQQQLRVNCAASSSDPALSSVSTYSFLNNMSTASSLSASLPFINPNSTCSSSLMHNVTSSSSSSSSSYPQFSLSQPSISLTDTDILQ